MIPPAKFSNSTEFGECWSEDQIILLLDGFSRGSCLPSNVVEDLSPYQYPPANLPEGIWYLVTNAEKESDNGFWKANGEPCRIYSNSMINGWRTTLQYFEGQAPHCKRTNWRMQEYKITGEALCVKNDIKDSRSLCRVFLCSGNSSNGEMNSVDCVDCESLAEPKQRKSVASSIWNTHISEAKKESEVKLLSVADDIEVNSFPEVSSDQECFLRGDYLELNDLEDDPAESHFSSSQNSSCPSKSSDEYFDSLALLRDLEEEDNKFKHESQSSSTHFVTTSPVRPKGVIMQPDSPGCLVSGAISTSLANSSPICSTSHGRLKDKKEVEHNSKRRKPDSQVEGTSISSNEARSSPSNKNTDGGKKASSRKLKKLKMYFCFMLL